MVSVPAAYASDRRPPSLIVQLNVSELRGAASPPSCDPSVLSVGLNVIVFTESRQADRQRLQRLSAGAGAS